MKGTVQFASFVILGGIALALGAYGAANPAPWCGDKQGCLPPDNTHAIAQAVWLYGSGAIALLILVLLANYLLIRARRTNR
ncbi:MAG: hypothetical protein QOJ81_2337 [Chloroflexota bacterium]|jgi:fructose-specific phosphotransferase system IIC component|nr:hypothetical protein [Chloroflexota bacterium]